MFTSGLIFRETLKPEGHQKIHMDPGVQRRAFEEFKVRLNWLSTLAKPRVKKDKKVINMYLADYESAISSVPVKEDGSTQYPIYFTSKVLHGAESNYSLIENVAFDILITSKRHCPSFQVHPTVVYSNIFLTDLALNFYLEHQMKVRRKTRNNLNGST